MRQVKTNQCVDNWGAYDQKPAYTYTCTPSAWNHNWNYNGNTGKIQQLNSNQCLTSINPQSQDNANVITYTCNDSGWEKWDAIYMGKYYE